MKKHHEEGNLENHHPDDRQHPHGSPHCPRNHELHGPRPDNVLGIALSLHPQSPTQEVADFHFVTKIMGIFCMIGRVVTEINFC